MPNKPNRRESELSRFAEIPESLSTSVGPFDPVRENSRKREQAIESYNVLMARQRMFHTHNDSEIIEALRYIEKKICKSGLSDEEIQSALKSMYASPEREGIFDLKIDQHLGLLYYFLLKLARAAQSPSREQLIDENKRWQEQKQKLLDVKPDCKIYKKVYIGAGFSIAAEICAQGKDFDHSESLIIGPPSPWTERNWVVGQPKQMLALQQDTQEPQKTGQTFFARWQQRVQGNDPERDQWPTSQEFAQWIGDVLSSSGIERRTDSVISIKRDENFYCLTYGDMINKQVIYAKDITIGTGTGKHDSRGIREQEGKIFDIDQFSSQVDTLEVDKNKRKDTVIIVVGGNAAINAVFQSFERGYRVIWITGKREVNFLPSLPNDVVRLPYLKYLMTKENDLQQKRKYQQEIVDLKQHLQQLYQAQRQDLFANIVEKFDQVKIDTIYFDYVYNAVWNDNHVVAELQDGTEIKGDFLVYAMGQDLSTQWILDNKIRKYLAPSTDKNFTFREPNEDSNYTILELRDTKSPPNCSLKIIGSLSSHLACFLKTQYERYSIQNNSQSDHSFHVQTLEHITKSLPGSVTFPDQITAIRSQIYASHSFMPPRVTKRAHFDCDDWNMLAVHIITNYPTISERPPLVGELTKMIVESRNEKGLRRDFHGLRLKGPDVLPIPPDVDAFYKAWNKELARLERRLQKINKLRELRTIFQPCTLL